MLLTAAAKAAGQQHPLTPFSANPSWQQGQKGTRELVQRGETIRKIRAGKREKKGRSSSSIIGQKLSVDSKGMEGFSTPNYQRLSMHS